MRCLYSPGRSVVRSLSLAYGCKGICMHHTAAIYLKEHKAFRLAMSKIVIAGSINNERKNWTTWTWIYLWFVSWKANANKSTWKISLCSEPQWHRRHCRTIWNLTHRFSVFCPDSLKNAITFFFTLTLGRVLVLTRFSGERSNVFSKRNF